MRWNLSLTETLGVATVGVALSLVAEKAAAAQADESTYRKIMYSTAVGMYVLGVVVGTNRPEKGWMIEGY